MRYMEEMKRVNRILVHPRFQIYKEEIKKWEEDRPFCGHDVSHLLDVARIACILALEEECEVSKEYIYTAALLHDIGRPEQYAHGTPHQQASVKIAAGILKDCGYDEEETAAVLSAVGNHRDAARASQTPLDWLIYRADKLSRGCYVCDVEEICDWAAAKKNQVLTY